jgi:hypothetical protein
MMKYQRNNIIFRIASAEAIAQFKRDQASSFLQLVRKELNFDVSAREAVLLEFDRFSQWIFRTERICCGAGEGEISPHLYIAIVESLLDELTVIETTMRKHEDVFTTLSCDYSKLIHSYSSEILSSKLRMLSGKRIDVAFCEAVAIISEYLQHLLLSFHEYNTNIARENKEPCISASNFTLNLLGEEFAAEWKRMQFFVMHGCGPTYVFKNYTEANLFANAVNYFDTLGILVVPEEEHSPSDFSPLG